MSIEVRPMTADELLAMPRGEFRYELVDGELKKMSPSGHNHGRIIVRLSTPLAEYVRRNRLGEVYAAETGFKLRSNPDTVLAPDIAYVQMQRVKAIGDAPGYWPGAPDLAVEVLSPNDRISEVERNISEWLNSSVQEVWIVNPKQRTLTVYRSPTDVVILTENDKLYGGELISGFELSIAELFSE